MNFPVLNTALAKRWNTFKKQLAKCRTKTDEDAIHDLRVSIRRLEATLRTISEFSPQFETKPTIRELKSLMKPYGTVRDAHVQRGWILKIFRRIGPGLNEYIKRLDRIDRNIGGKALKQATGFKPKISERFIASYMTRSALDERKGTEEQFAAKAFEVMNRLYGEMLAFEPDVFDEKKISALHKLRIAVKRYRYTAEIIAPAFSERAEENLDVLHDYQTLLGEIHDLDLLRVDFIRFAKKQKRTIYERDNLMRSARTLKQSRADMFTDFLAMNKRIKNTIAPKSLMRDSASPGLSDLVNSTLIRGGAVE